MRLLGYDTTYERDITDDRVVELAKAEGRVVLTRDRSVARRASASVLVSSHDLDGQIGQVLAAMGLPVPSTIALERCSMCNAPIVPADGQEARAGGVPERVLSMRSQFWRCPACRRFYWRGTHVESMERRLSGLAAREPGPRLAPRKR